MILERSSQVSASHTPPPYINNITPSLFMGPLNFSFLSRSLSYLLPSLLYNLREALGSSWHKGVSRFELVFFKVKRNAQDSFPSDSQGRPLLSTPSRNRGEFSLIGIKEQQQCED